MMVHFRTILFALALVVALTNGANALDRGAFTFTRWDLNVKADPAKGSFEASGTIRLRNDSATPQMNVALQISSTLQWTNISQAETVVPFLAQTYTSDLDHTGELSEAIVTLPKAVAPKETLTLQVTYRGTIPRNATRLTRVGTPVEFANSSEWDAIGGGSAAVRGVSYVTWFPVALNSLNLSESTTMVEELGAWKNRHAASVLKVELEVPRTSPPAPPYSVRWNSAQTSNCAADGTSLCSEATFTGFTYAPTFVIAPLDVLERPLVKVSFRYEHASLSRDYAAALERWAPMQAEWFGPPKEKVQVVDIGEANASPFDSGPYVFTNLRPLDRATLEFAMAHQLAHASFQSDRLWISEGLAHLMQALVRESQSGRKGALQYLSQFTRPLVETEKSVVANSRQSNASAANSLVTSTDPLYFRGKALFVWWMLRDMLGEPALQSVIKAYKPAEDTQPAYLQSLLERTAPGTPPRNLEWFFDDWVYRDRGLPDFRIESAYPRKTLSGTYIVTVTVENLGDAGAEVPVSVISGSGEVSERVIVRGKSKSVIRVQSPQPPTRVVVNDGSVPETETSNNTFEVKAPQP